MCVYCPKLYVCFTEVNSFISLIVRFSVVLVLSFLIGIARLRVRSRTSTAALPIRAFGVLAMVAVRQTKGAREERGGKETT